MYLHQFKKITRYRNVIGDYVSSISMYILSVLDLNL
jgi:hypothetical protein